MSTFRKLPSIYAFSYFPFGFEDRMWDLIVSVPDHCLSFYLSFRYVGLSLSYFDFFISLCEFVIMLCQFVISLCGFIFLLCRFFISL